MARMQQKVTFYSVYSWFDGFLVSVFNGISTFIDYSMLKLFSLKNSSGTI